MKKSKIDDSAEDFEFLVCGEQQPIMVFLNQAGSISISSYDQWNDLKEVQITIEPVFLDHLIDALQTMKAKVKP